MANKQAERARNQFSNLEIDVLKQLKARKFVVSKSASTGDSVSPREIPGKDISDLAQCTGSRDNEEVVRALYTLEGKSLVKPFPEGDFTSHIWEITDDGVKVLGILT